ncbi:MAG TPA: protein kinase [Candidatus Krumholzibacteria bacterium]|nr:protein kinase [Candidatus Krumholzibacteria bacterium]
MSEGKSYRILETVASGGTAVLYRALQISLDRVVAVKRLHAHLTQDENFTRRFVLEAKAAASLDHQNIVRVIDFGIEDGSYQMVMEFVEGESLKDVFDRWRPMQPDLALAIVHQVCRGLEHAHAKGIVHRDIKPGNIMLTKLGVAKITDFGLAKLTQGTTVQTAADSILGTPLYMSPEQAFGESVDQRSDLFSLGTVLYELLTGRQPFAGENYMGVIQNIINKEIPAVRDLNPEVPIDAEHIVMRALAKDREQRFSSAREFREAIEAVLGTDGLARATAVLPALLDRGGRTLMLSKSAMTPAPSKGMSTSSSSWSTVSSVKKRHHSAPPIWATMAVIAVLLGGGATWFFWPRLHPSANVIEPGAVQQSAMNESNGLVPPVDPALTHADSTAADSSARAAVATRDTTATARTAAAAPAPAKQPEVGLVPVPVAPEKIIAVVDSTAKAAAAAQTKTAAPVKVAKPRVEAEKTFPQGYLMLNCEPDAKIYINGIFRGDAAPTLRLTLPEGLLSIECRAPGYESYLETLSVTVDELSQRNITLRKEMGIISLATTEGAQFYVDDALIGTTPIMKPINIPAGTHTLTITKDGFFTWSSNVTVEANATMPLHITLSPRY